MPLLRASKHVTLREACSLIGITPGAYYKRAHKPFPGRRFPGSRRIMVLASDVEAYISRAEVVYGEPMEPWEREVEARAAEVFRVNGGRL